MSKEISGNPASNDDSGNGCIPLSKIVADAPPPGNCTRFMVQPLPDGKYRLLNGHRRYATLMSIVARGTDGFSPDMMIPVVIIAANAGDQAVAALIAAENQLPEPISCEAIRKAVIALHRQGLSKAVIALHRQGLSNAAIASVLALPISTVEQHLA